MAWGCMEPGGPVNKDPFPSDLQASLALKPGTAPYIRWLRISRDPFVFGGVLSLHRSLSKRPEVLCLHSEYVEAAN